jgi:hypothetical protein
MRLYNGFTFFTQGLTKSLKNLDVFAQPVKIHYDSKGSLGSGLGGCLTLASLAVVLFLTQSMILGVITQTNLHSQPSTTFSIDPGVLNFTRENFQMGIIIWDPIYAASFQNHAIFDVYFVMYTNERQANGKQKLSRTQLPTKFCDAADFPLELNASFYSFGMFNAICLDIDAITIQGNYQSLKFAALEIGARPCVNGTNSLYTCAPQEYIDNYIATHAEIYFNLNFVNRMVQETNYSNPTVPFIDTIMWVLSPGKLSKYSDVYIREIEIETVTDLLGLSTPQVIKSFLYAQEAAHQSYISAVVGDHDYLKIQLRRSSYTQNYSRHFDTLGDILAVMSGYWGSLIFLLGIFTFKFNETNYDVRLANQIEKDKINQLLGNLPIFDYPVDIATNSLLITPTERTREQKHIPDFTNSMEDYQISSDTTNQDHKFKIAEVCCFEFCPCIKKKDFKREQWKKFQDRMETSTDVLTIIHKLGELERLKTLLLNPPQLMLFNQLASTPFQMYEPDALVNVEIKDEIAKINENNKDHIDKYLTKVPNSEINSGLQKQFETIIREKMCLKELSAEEASKKAKLQQNFKKVDPNDPKFHNTSNMRLNQISNSPMMQDNSRRAHELHRVHVAPEWDKHWSWIDEDNKKMIANENNSKSKG